MLIVETIARIRREHFIKGKTIKEIARDLKVSRNTVRKVLRSGCPGSGPAAAVSDILISLSAGQFAPVRTSVGVVRGIRSHLYTPALAGRATLWARSNPTLCKVRRMFGKAFAVGVTRRRFGSSP